MEVLPLNQYFTSNKKSGEKNFAALPLNLLYLGSFLQSRNLKCKIYELGAFSSKESVIDGDRIRHGLSDENVTEIIQKEKPKIVGLGCMYSRHYIDVVNIAVLIKKLLKIVCNHQLPQLI